MAIGSNPTPKIKKKTAVTFPRSCSVWAFHWLYAIKKRTRQPNMVHELWRLFEFHIGSILFHIKKLPLLQWNESTQAEPFIHNANIHYLYSQNGYAVDFPYTRLLRLFIAKLFPSEYTQVSWFHYEPMYVQYVFKCKRKPIAEIGLFVCVCVCFKCLRLLHRQSNVWCESVWCTISFFYGNWQSVFIDFRCAIETLIRRECTCSQLFPRNTSHHQQFHLRWGRVGSSNGIVNAV